MSKWQVYSLILCVTALLSKSLALKGGQSVNPCDYPGLAVVTNPSNDVIFCDGVITSGDLLVPEMCGSALLQLNKYTDVSVRYGYGELHSIPANTISGSTLSGIYKVTLDGFAGSGCYSGAVLYDPDTMTLDLSSCELVAYGGETSDDTTYTNNSNSIPITVSTSAPCCESVKEAMTEEQQGVIVDENAPFNCLTSETGAACGLGDLGGPVYCTDTSSSIRAVTALTSSTPCEVNQPFLAHDLTSEDPNFKFGLSST